MTIIMANDPPSLLRGTLLLKHNGIHLQGGHIVYEPVDIRLDIIARGQKELTVRHHENSMALDGGDVICQGVCTHVKQVNDEGGAFRFNVTVAASDDFQGRVCAFAAPTLEAKQA